MRFRDFVSTGPVLQLGLLVGRYLSRRVGYGLAGLISSVIARLRPEIYRVVLANLSQVMGPQVSRRDLNRTARQVFFHAGQNYYDFFRALELPIDLQRQAVSLPAALIEHIRSSASKKRGVLLVGPHVSNFNMVILALGAYGVPIQLLSVARPSQAYRAWNQMLEQGSMHVTPISAESLKVAIRRLRQGGVVFTGADRPVPGDQAEIAFFGRSSLLPTGPARIALMSDALVIVGACSYDPTRGYVLEITGPVEMVRTGDRQADILLNAGRLAAMMENYVRARPEQWLMFYPVWEEVTR
jgi:lauroyl/myristoyl acyltransferase